MANHKSAIKRNRQSIKRNLRNKSLRTTVKNAVQTLREVLHPTKKKKATPQAASAAELMVKTTSALAKAARKGTIHRKKAARLTSRLQKAVNQA